MNSSKYGVTLDLTKPQGREVAYRFVKWADIVTEGYTPGVMAKFGLDYEAVRRIKPDIVMFSSSGQGQRGPHAQHPLFGHVVLALSGLNHFVGWPDRAPVGPYGPWTDFFTPHIIAGITIAALDYRDRTGKGQYIDAANVEAGGYGCLGSSFLDLTVNGREQIRMGNRHPTAAPHAAYRCQGEERWVDISVFTDDEWTAFCKVIGEPEWTREPRFATLAGRKANEDELDCLVQEWTANYSSEEVMVLMQSAGVAAGVVQNAKDLHEDAQLRARGHFWWLDHPETGLSSYSGAPFRLSKCEPDPSPAPCLGAHNELALREWLGYTEAEISELAAAEVFQ
jgi:crotonobetainyl-CoA:carnitine CoA-transferase CaiB-like acyl-CoA transferase